MGLHVGTDTPFIGEKFLAGGCMGIMLSGRNVGGLLIWSRVQKGSRELYTHSYSLGRHQI
jgi:hypothetical protein